MLPATKQEVQFLLTSDQSRQRLPAQGLEAALSRTWSDCDPGSDRFGEALQSMGAKVLNLEQVAKELSRAFGNDDAIRLGDTLQSRGNIRGLPHDAALLSLARPDQVADDNKPSGNADASL